MREEDYKKESTLFEQSSPGRVGYSIGATQGDLPQNLVPNIEPHLLRENQPLMPEVSEPQVVRHFTRLSQFNHSIDAAFYPLGSCTMKYNPRINETMAALDGFQNLHPYQDNDQVQGALELMYKLQEYLAEISGMDAVSLQPAAGAQGEFVGLLLIKSFHDNLGEKRSKILIPDSAHGTNPASSHLCGYAVVTLKSNAHGVVSLEEVEAHMDADTAGLMITNPNTLGFFEENIKEIADVIHERGGFVYCDGANQNALVGNARVGDMGVDVLHFNLHKTFTTPHGGGGPGSGPVAVKKSLADFLPKPVILKEDERFLLDYDREKSFGRIKSFFGNFGMFVRAYTYIREMGVTGLRRMSELALLNATYIKESLRGYYHLPIDRPCMHEVVFNDKLQNEYGVKTLDIAKRLLDFGFHPPTVYFPLVVPGALMIEPTETEAKETLDSFIAAMKEIAREAKENPEHLKAAPHKTQWKRLDEVKAVRQPRLVWSSLK